MENEIWKPVAGYEGALEVSNMGRVRSLPRIVVFNDALHHKHYYKGRILRQSISSAGRKSPRCSINVGIDGKKMCFLVHRLVAKAFIPNPNNLPQINHKDENQLNNRVDNLEWCTCEYNLNYGTRNKRASVSSGKPVKQFTLSGEYINTYSGAREAARALGLDSSAGSNILSCSIGKKKTAYGYKWTRV